jgi:outer membrane lipoprotein carrier protein
MKKLLIFVLIILFAAIPSFAQNEGQQILESLQKKFDSVKDITAGFMQSSNGRVNLYGKFYFKKKNNLRLELKNSTIISNGKTNWNYNKPENKVIISSYNEHDPSVLSLNNFINIYPSECNIELMEIKDQKVLMLTPQKSGLNFKYVKIWTDSKHLISKMIIEDLNDVLIQIDFSNYKLNSNLPDSLFNFTPPKGSKVIDLR